MLSKIRAIIYKKKEEKIENLRILNIGVV